MRRPTTLRLALALLVAAALCLPTAAAAAPRGYHIFGDVALNGAIKDGAVLHIQSRDGSVDLHTTYGEPRAVDTPHGTMHLADRYGPAGPSAPMEGWMHFFVEVPAGTYRLDVTSGGRTFVRVVEANGTAYDTVDFPHGTYYLLDLGEVKLDVPGAAEPTPEPTPTPRLQPTPAPTPPTPAPTAAGAPTLPPTPTSVDPAPTVSPTAAATPAPTPQADADAAPTPATPGPALALLVAGLAGAALALRRRA